MRTIACQLIRFRPQVALKILLVSSVMLLAGGCDTGPNDEITAGADAQADTLEDSNEGQPPSPELATDDQRKIDTAASQLTDLMFSSDQRPAPQPPVTAGDWIAPENRVPIKIPGGTHFTSANGPIFTWDQLRSRPMLAAFFYTRDRNRKRNNVAPKLYETVAHRLEERGLAESVNLVLFTLEPHFDSPQSISRWAGQFDLTWPTVALLEPPEEELEKIVAAFSLDTERVDIETLNFTPRLFAIDDQGRLAWVAQGDDLNDTDAIIDVLVRLENVAGGQ